MVPLCFRLAVLLAGLLALGTVAAQAAGTKVPAGVYLHVDIEYLLQDAKKEDASQSDKDKFIQSELVPLLKTSAIAGITVGLRWNTLEPDAPLKCGGPLHCAPYTSGFNWNDLDDVLTVVKGMPGKSVQLIITPGFDAPQWLKNQLKPCDALFAKDTTQAKGAADWDCGSADFVDFPEQGRANKDEGSGKSGEPRFTLPLPWSSDYQSAWRYFLEALSQHVHGQPQLVAIQIAGPIGASDEMILPTTLNGPDSDNNKRSVTRVGSLPADTAWTILIQNYDRDPDNQHPQYATNSDDIFIDAWKTAIDDYARLFPDLTLVLSPDSGNDMPTFGLNAVTPHQDNLLYTPDCDLASKGNPTFAVSCEAKTEVISYFLKQWAELNKGTEVGGLTAQSQNKVGDIGVPGTKILTAPMPTGQWTQQLAIAGAQFDHPASNLKDKEGCLKGDDCPKDAEEATANVLKALFDGTAADKQSGVTTQPGRTINYVDVPTEDVEYMETQGCNAPQGETSVLQQIAAADATLLSMAGDPPPAQTGLCGAVVKPPVKQPTVKKSPAVNRESRVKHP